MTKKAKGRERGQQAEETDRLTGTGSLKLHVPYLDFINGSISHGLSVLYD